MGPIALFDKSFLQSLSPDEAVWFDHFFYTNVCPIFTMECMADLKLTKLKSGKTPEQELAGIANKFPKMHGMPNTTHINLYTGELLGKNVPMGGQIITSQGRLEKSKDGNVLIIDDIPERDAFDRWKNREFYDMERLYSAQWRNVLANFDLGKIKKIMNSYGIDAAKCKTFKDAKNMSEGAITGPGDPFDKMDYLLSKIGLNIPRLYHRRIWVHWGSTDFLPLDKFAPYASFVLTIQTFYYISLAANLPYTNSPKGLIDIMYLFYLPFCMIFISCDRIHHACAPLFLRENQLYIEGNELKKDLKEINQYYLQLPQDVREKGSLIFARTPPKDGDFLIGRIWDRFMPNWREEIVRDLPDTGHKNINMNY